MKISEDGLAIIKRFEGYRGRPYLCPAGKATIGYGSTFYPDGHPVAMTDRAISEAEAGAILADVVGDFAAGVSKLVRVQIEQHEFDALVCFAYNVGMGNFAASTMLKKLNAGDRKGAAAEFPRWNKSGGKVLDGLTARRAAERDLFLGADDVAA